MLYEYLLCNCRTPHHGVLIQPDDEIDGAFTVSVVSTKTAGFWRRLGRAVRHVLFAEPLIRADVVLERAEAERLTAFLNAPFDSALKHKAGQQQAPH